MTRTRALALRAWIEKLSAGLSDADSSTCAELFPRLKENGELIEAGTRINYGGVIKKAAVSLWDTVENNPDNAPNLWADIDYINGIRKIPAVITVTLAFSYGELGIWEDGGVYRSLMEGNVYTPEEAADQWELVK